MLSRPGLRVAVLCSARAPGLVDLVCDDPNRGRLYDLVLCMATDPECGELALLDAARIPSMIHDLRRFYASRRTKRSDLGVRRDYDRRTAELLTVARVDLVVLCGYLHIVTEPLLATFPRRIINVHDADLTVLDADGRPKYRGLHATRDAVFAGEPETRSTMHIVTAEVDVGPLLVRSDAFPTHPMVNEARRWGATDILKAYAYAQREWMMRASWGTLLARAIELYARGQVRLEEARVA